MIMSNFRLLIKLSWRNVWRNRRRSGITIASIVFSVMVLVFSEAILVGTHAQMALQALDTYGVGQIQIHARGYQKDPTIFRSFIPQVKLLSFLKADRQIQGFAPRVESDGLAAVGQESKGVMIVGIDPTQEETVTPLSEKLVKGSYLAAGDLKGVLVGDRLLENVGAKLGESLALITQTRFGTLGAARFQIRGVFHTGVSELDGGLIYLNIRSAQQLLAFGNRVTMLVLKLRDPTLANLNQVKRAVLARVNEAKIEVLTWPEFMPELVQILRLDSAGGYLFLLILLLVIAFGVLNTILMAVLERTREFGVLLSIGTKPRRIFGMIIMEAVFISLIGAGIGALLGSLASAYVVHHPLNLSGSSMASFSSLGVKPLLYARLSLGIVVYPTLVVLGLGVLMALSPALRAARFEPAEALHHA